MKRLSTVPLIKITSCIVSKNLLLLTSLVEPRFPGTFPVGPPTTPLMADRYNRPQLPQANTQLPRFHWWSPPHKDARYPWPVPMQKRPLLVPQNAARPANPPQTQARQQTQRSGPLHKPQNHHNPPLGVGQPPFAPPSPPKTSLPARKHYAHQSQRSCLKQL